MTAIRTVLDISAIVNDSPGAHQYALQKASSGLLIPVTIDINPTSISNGGGSVAVDGTGNILNTLPTGANFEVNGAAVLDSERNAVVNNVYSNIGFFTSSGGTLKVDGAWIGNTGWLNNYYTKLAVQIDNPGLHGIVIRGASEQDVAPWVLQDSFGDVLAQVDASGGGKFQALQATGTSLLGTTLPSGVYLGTNSGCGSIAFRDGIISHAGSIDNYGGDMRFVLGGYVRYQINGADGALNLIYPILQMNGTQVLTSRQPAVAHATNSSDVITQLNALIDRLSAGAGGHGLIA